MLTRGAESVAALGALVALVIWAVIIVRVWAPAAERRGGRWYLEAQFVLATLTMVSVAFYPVAGSPGVLGQVTSLLNQASVALAVISLADASRAPRKAAGWFLAATVGLYVAHLLSTVAGAQFALPATYLTTPLVVLSFLWNGTYTYEWLISAARVTLRWVIGLSLAAAALVPSVAFNYAETRTLFGIPRVAGITGHPNGLGFYAALLLLLEMFHPARRTRFWATAALVGVALAQSRTAWVVAAVSLLFVASQFGRIYRLASLAVTGIIGAVAVFSAGASRWLPVLWSDITDDGLNGRTRIWEAALRGFQQYPLFGHGPTLLNEQYIASTLGDFDAAAQAHNDWVQILAGAGIVGFIAFSVLMLSLLIRSARAAPIDPLPLALTVAMLLRTFVETPFRPTGTGMSTLFIATVLCLVVLSPLKPTGRPGSHVISEERRGGRVRTASRGSDRVLPVAHF